MSTGYVLQQPATYHILTCNCSHDFELGDVNTQVRRRELAEDSGLLEQVALGTQHSAQCSANASSCSRSGPS